MTLTRALILRKLKVTTVHIALSLVIFLPILYLLIVEWFPGALFATSGGWQGLRIMLLCDLVIGPLLTFLVFNPAKSRRALWFDFSLIGLAQAASIAYGIVAVTSQRPVAVAFSEGVLQPVIQQEFDSQTIDAAEWARLGDGKPYWVFRREPKGPDEIAGVMTFAMVEGVAVDALFFLYEPLKANAGALAGAQVDQAKVIKEIPALAAKFKAIEAQALELKSPTPLLWLRLGGRYADAYICFDADLKQVNWIKRDLE